MADYSDSFDSANDSDQDDQYNGPTPVVAINDANVQRKVTTKLQHQSSTHSNESEDGVYVDSGALDIELHGRGEKMKISRQSPEVLIRKYRKQVEISKSENNFDLVIEDLIRLTALARIVYGDNDWNLADAESKLAKAYWELKELAPQAQRHAEEARNIMLRVVQNTGAHQDRQHIYRVLLSVYITLGEAHTAQNRYTDAELSFQKAEKIFGEQERLKNTVMIDEDPITELKTHMCIAQAKLASKQGKAASSLAYFEEAIELTQGEYGEDSLKLVPLYQMVGKVEQSRETPNHDKSIEAFQQAHSVTAANFSNGTSELADTGYQLALSYTRVNSEDAEISGESYLNDCLATYQSVFGPCHEKTISCRDELARLMLRTNRVSEAIQMIKTTLPHKRETFGEYSESLASAYKLLGSVYMTQNDTEKSYRALSKCMEIQTFLHGDNSRKVRDTQKNIDLLLKDDRLKAKVEAASRGKPNMSSRPRFNTIVKANHNLGGFKACF